ncbi:MAG: cobalamin biosynthesis protein CobD [Firmicutes bacterium]|nr:cobalamin biosynthesis protein CobD [Bacillota bacterium]
MLIALSTFTAFILDQIFGDPRNFPHPVVIIGKLISAMERFTRKVFPKTNIGELVAGAFTWVIVATVSFAVPFIALVLLAMVNVWAAFALNTFWSYQIFASKSLKEQSMLVYRYLEAEDLPNSRKYLSWIVGRDTSELDPEEITKAVVETVAENTSDGVTAPMLYMMILGAPLGMLYKAINTMDSMLGYKNDRYMYFGRIPAKIDDVANFIPARITGLLMCLTAPLIGLDGRNAYRIYKRDRLKHLSPNSGHLEAACAGAMHIMLGGDSYYFGKLVEKASLGDPDREVRITDIPLSIKMMYASSLAMLALLEVVRIVLVLI